MQNGTFKSNKQRNVLKTLVFVGVLKVNDENNPLFRGMAPWIRIRIHTKMSCIRNTGREKKRFGSMLSFYYIYTRLVPGAVTKNLSKKSQLKTKSSFPVFGSNPAYVFPVPANFQCCDVMLQELCRAEQIWLHLEGHAVSGLVLLPSEG